MPTYCEPWPGKTKATGRAPYGAIIPTCGSGDGHLPLDVIPGLAHGAKLLGVFIGNLHPVFLFEGHDQLDEIEGIGLQVLGKGGVRGYLLDIDAELLRDDAPELVEIRVGHSTLLLVWSPGAGSRPNLVYTIANRSVPQWNTGASS